MHKNLSTQVVYEKNLSHLTKPSHGKGLYIDLFTADAVTGRKEGIDWTCCMINPNATEANPSVKMASTRKVDFYDKAIDNVQEHFNLVPAAIDTCGRFGNPLLDWCKRIVTSGNLEETSYSRALFDFKTTIAVAHWKAIGNQMIVLLKEANQDIGGKFPGAKGFHPGGDLDL